MTYKSSKTFPITGFMIFYDEPQLLDSRYPDQYYRGISRRNFTLEYVESEMLPKRLWKTLKPMPIDFLYKAYLPGWRREAYKLFEPNLYLSRSESNTDILESFSVAVEIKKIAEPHTGKLEILRCEIMPIEYEPPKEGFIRSKFLGYDIAYFGVDNYSALFEAYELIKEKNYEKYINKYGLFSNHKIIPQYLRDFTDEIKSESYDDFFMYRLHEAE